MTVERGDIRAALQSAYWSGEDFRRKSRKRPPPDDVPGFVDDARRRARAVPEGLANLNFEPTILRCCEFAEHYLKAGNDEKVREYCCRIQINLDHLDHDIEIYNIYLGKRRGGAVSKKNPYAKTVAQYLCREFPKATYDQIWESITYTSTTHGEGTFEELDITFNRDGDKLWIMGSKEVGFTKSTFEKQYLREARKAAGESESK